MRVHTKIVLDMSDCSVIFEEGFEYDGAVDLLKGGGGGAIEETAHEKALAQISNEQWHQYTTRLAPYEDKLIAKIDTTAADQSAIAGKVNADVASSYDNAPQQVVSQTAAQGLTPASGQFKQRLGMNALERGKVTSRALGAASQAADDQTYIKLQEAIAMGRGEAADTTRDMTTLARDASSQAISDARNSQDKSSSMASSVASTAGMGLAAWNNMKTPTITADKQKTKF
jgi:hypothetical protein